MAGKFSGVKENCWKANYGPKFHRNGDLFDRVEIRQLFSLQKQKQKQKQNETKLVTVTSRRAMNFTEDLVVTKLRSLHASQDSIQSMSLWLFHYKSHAAEIVTVWLNEMNQAAPLERLKFLFLANDVILQAKRKGAEYLEAFKPVLPEACAALYNAGHEKSRLQLEKMLKLWQERGVYSSAIIANIRGVMKGDLSLPKGDQSLIGQDLGDPIAKEPFLQSISAKETAFTAVSAAYRKLEAETTELCSVSATEKLETSTEVHNGIKARTEAIERVEKVLRDIQAFVEDCEPTVKEFDRFILQERQETALQHLKVQEIRETVLALRKMRKELDTHLANLPDDLVGGDGDPVMWDEDDLPDADEIFGVGAPALPISPTTTTARAALPPAVSTAPKSALVVKPFHGRRRSSQGGQPQLKIPKTA